MRIFILIALGLFSNVVFAQMTWIVLEHPAPVYRQGRADSALLVMANPRERIALRKRGERYSQVQIKRSGKWRVGYMLTSDLFPSEKSYLRGDFAYGGGGFFSYLRHDSKDFMNEDQVSYKTEPFTSATFSPFLSVQSGHEDFWRFGIGYRRVSYTSRASTNLTGSPTKDLQLEHSMFSLMIQKMWTPLTRPNFFFGIGFEYAKALRSELLFGTNKLPVSDEDRPGYIGGQINLGYQVDLGRALSGFAELRGSIYPNQKPMIIGLDAVAGLLYWP